MPSSSMKKSSASIPRVRKRKRPASDSLNSTLADRPFGLPRHKRIGGLLVFPIVLSPALQSLPLRQGNPGDIDERPSHPNRTDQRQRPARRANGHDDIGPPVKPLEEIVGMTRPIPKPVATHTLAIPGAGAKA